MTARFPWWHAAVLGGILLGCSDDRSAGGGGFEGETVAIAGIVRDEGHPLPGARVVWSSTDDREVRSTSTDASGRFELRVRAVEPGFLEVVSGDSLVSRSPAASPSSLPSDVSTSASTLWNAILTRDGLPVAGAKLRIVGSGTVEASSATGSFQLVRKTSASEWVEIALPPGDTLFQRLPALSDSVLEADFARTIPVDDFEGPDTRSALGRTVGSGWWFALTDSLSGGTSRFTPQGVVENFRLAYTRQDAWVGTSLSLGFEVDASRPVRYAQAGLELADQGLWLDLSRLDSLTFRAKGSGSLRMEIFTSSGLVPSTDPVGQFQVPVSPESTWTRHVVRASDLKAPAGSRAALDGLGWRIAAKQVRRLVFTASDSATLQLDDLVFHGPRLSDLYPRR